jgi:hypothetical protein
VNETADAPVTESVNDLSEFAADARSTGASCVVCASPSTTQPTDPRPAASPGNEAGQLPVTLPMLHLCDEHWSAYRTDWLLLGWCVDHYAEALRYCEVHERDVPPL